MRFKHASQFRMISLYSLFYSRMDLDALKNKLRSVEHDLPRSYILNMKRKQLIDTLLTNDFGSDAVIEYKGFTAEADRLKQFVEGKISADHV